MLDRSPRESSRDKRTSNLRKETINDAVIRLAGNSQDGIQSVGGFLARLAGRNAQDVMTYMTIPSTISGGPSIYQVRIGSGEILSAGDEADFLVAFYQHSYEEHIEYLREGGVLIYDTEHVKPDISDKRFVPVGIPITGLTIEAVGGTSKDKGKNIFILGLLANIFTLDVEKLHGLITERIGGKGKKILRNALLAFDSGYAYPVDNVLDRYYTFIPAENDNNNSQVTMDGNQALAYGLIAAGVRYGAGYPITPWSPVMETLRSELPKYGGTFVQAEDEIAAISIALGFSYSGHLAVTGSSGPGISLKMEGLGWAVMAEMPLIVVNIQRGGPSTGLPTNVEQSDLMQAIYGSHGDTPRVVIAPRDVEDCFYTALEAAKIASEYSTPVIILSDLALATRIEAFDDPHLEDLVIEPKLDLSPHSGEYHPYAINRITRHIVPGTRIEEGSYPVVTGLEHDESGHPTANPQLHMKMTAKRREKIKRLAATLPQPEVFGDESGDILFVGWGSTWGPIHEATVEAREQGEKTGHIHLRHLHPLPNNLEIIFSRYRQIFIVESNDVGLYGYGQLASLLRARYCNPAIRSISKTDGLIFKVREILRGKNELRSEQAASFSSFPEY